MLALKRCCLYLTNVVSNEHLTSTNCIEELEMDCKAIAMIRGFLKINNIGHGDFNVDNRGTRDFQGY